MGTLDTKLLIADALVQLCEEQPLKKVSISDIVERTGKNRKTFYYHFEDKNALIIWKFRYDLGLELQNRFPENILVYKKDEDPSLSSFPFYITQKSGVRSLDHSKFFDAFAIVLERNRAFYMQAFAETGPATLREYLYDLYLPALRNDITINLGQPLPARRKHRLLKRVLHLRVPFLFHAQVRAARHQASDQQRRAFFQHHPQLHGKRNQGSAIKAQPVTPVQLNHGRLRQCQLEYLSLSPTAGAQSSITLG